MPPKVASAKIDCFILHEIKIKTGAEVLVSETRILISLFSARPEIEDLSEMGAEVLE
jgi:hypothetical protein